jgi:hypothetical protein
MSHSSSLPTLSLQVDEVAPDAGKSATLRVLCGFPDSEAGQVCFRPAEKQWALNAATLKCPLLREELLAWRRRDSPWLRVWLIATIEETAASATEPVCFPAPPPLFADAVPEPFSSQAAFANDRLALEAFAGELARGASAMIPMGSVWTPVTASLDPVPVRYQLCAVTMIQGMPRRTLEWIAYMMVMGVEHFFLYDNHVGKDELWDQLLEPLAARGLVTAVHMPFGYHHVDFGSWQRGALSSCANGLCRACEWVCSWDVDEFFVSGYMRDHMTKMSFHRAIPRFLRKLQLSSSHTNVRVHVVEMAQRCAPEQCNVTALVGTTPQQERRNRVEDVRGLFFPWYVETVMPVARHVYYRTKFIFRPAKTDFIISPHFPHSHAPGTKTSYRSSDVLVHLHDCNCRKYGSNAALDIWTGILGTLSPLYTEVVQAKLKELNLPEIL